MYNFDNKKREITFNSCITPTPWMNYLSNGTFHVMLSQAGGGLAFYKTPQIWRINRYHFYSPVDRGGFYAYIKDGDEYWCPTSEPVATKPNNHTATHGMGYSRFEGERNGVKTSATYFVGPLEDCMVWSIKFTSDTDKTVKVFPYVELGMMEYMREIQWHCYNKDMMKCYPVKNDTLVFNYDVIARAKEDETPLIYFASDAKLTGFDCDREEFLGYYRSEENPQCVEEGKCRNSEMYGGDPCFALELEVELKAGVEKTVNIFMGSAMTEEDVEKCVKHCREDGFVEKNFSALHDYWENFFSKFQVELPDTDAMTMINTWNPYQAERNFQFSRNISFYATGTARGVGVRDTAQDILSMVPFDLRRAKDRLNLLVSQQYNDGHVNHYCFPLEGWDPVTSIHSDDHLWLIMTAYNIVIEEGKLDYLDEVVDFYDGGKATVWEHLKKCVEFTLANIGPHGIPLTLHSDWNDTLHGGESVWTAMQFGTVLRQIAELAKLRGEDDSKYSKLYDEQKATVNKIAWDGEWYARCFRDGRVFGSKAERQAQIWLNPQTWSVISGMNEHGTVAMDSVKRLLDSELGIKKLHPVMDKEYPTKAEALTGYNKGMGENASVFCHANTWAIIAECMLKRPENAYKYYHQLLPMIVAEKAGIDRYKAEPYVYSSNIFGPDSDLFGRANVSWLSGTAAWMYVAATQYMLGIRATWDGLEIDPCLPKEMLPAKVTREFRGKKYEITITENKRQFIKA